MAEPSVARVVLSATVCWAVACGSLSAQTWDDLLGALGPTPTAQPEVASPTPPAEPTPAPAADAVEASFALREALLVAAEGAVGQASWVDGFAGNRDIRVPLPGKLEESRDTLTRFGLRQEVDELELAMNRAAEATAAEAGFRTSLRRSATSLWTTRWRRSKPVGMPRPTSSASALKLLSPGGTQAGCDRRDGTDGSDRGFRAGSRSRAATWSLRPV